MSINWKYLEIKIDREIENAIDAKKTNIRFFFGSSYGKIKR